MRRSLIVAGLVTATVSLGCREQQPTQRVETPPTNAPADVSHGEAPIGTAAAPAPIDPAAPPRSTSRVHRLRVAIKHAKITIADGVTYDAWTFDGRVPGPVLRVTQGDTVDFTLVNEAPMPHSLDFHAAEIAPSRAYVNLMPHDSLHYRFVARVPGAFMYHCGTAPVALHIANGMYGAIIVDPRQGRRAPAAVRRERGAEPVFRLPRGRRDLRSRVHGWVGRPPARRRADGDGPGRWWRHFRSPPGRSGNLSICQPCVRGRDQGRSGNVLGSLKQAPPRAAPVRGIRRRARRRHLPDGHRRRGRDREGLDR